MIPTRNEARNLPRCLDALQGWAREVIIVDSQSTDGTLAIAEAYNVPVVQFDYQGGWPKKRQWMLDQDVLRHDWTLLLDADELRREDLISIQQQGP
ncbi:MAG: glycosyltransferase, partial [Bacteroidota bacterium]